MFSLLALLVFSAGATAAEQQRQYNTAVSSGTVEYCLNAFIERKPPAFFSSCDVEVTVSIGAGSTYAKVTVTAKDVDCSKLFQIIKQLKAQARAALA